MLTTGNSEDYDGNHEDDNDVHELASRYESIEPSLSPSITPIINDSQKNNKSIFTIMRRKQSAIGWDSNRKWSCWYTHQQ